MRAHRRLEARPRARTPAAARVKVQGAFVERSSAVFRAVEAGNAW